MMHQSLRNATVFVIVALIILFALLVTGARALTATADEPAYVAGGYALLAEGQAAMPMVTQRGYAPLVPAMEAALVFLGTPDLPVTSLPGWPDAYDVFAQAWFAALPSPSRTVFLSRMPVIGLSMLLAALVVRWARDIAGPWAAVLTLGALLLDPSLLAHGRLATTDLPVTFFGAAALYAAWRWHRAGGWRWALSAGLLMGATALAKLSGMIWVGCAGVLMVARFLKQQGRRSARGAVVQLLLSVAVTYLLVWGAYGFAWGKVRVLGLWLPAPNYWRSGFYLDAYRSPFFALGRYGRQTWWWYFPVAFLIKNPLPLLLLWAGGCVGMLARPSSRRTLAPLLFFPALYTGVAIIEGMNLGYRHMLPIHPFAHVIAGAGLAAWLGIDRLHGARPSAGRRLPMRRWVVGLLGVWYAFVTFRTTPNELAFFSTLIGGPEQGYRYLVDANLDWGQYGHTVDAYLAEHPEVQLAPPTSPLRPASGRYLVGASALQGVGGAGPATYAWFRHREPVDQVNFGLLIYDVRPFPMTWVAQCGAPELPLDADEIQSGTGHNDLRQVSFDCTQAWLYPGGAASPGLYVLDRDLLHRADPSPWHWLAGDPVAGDAFVARRLAPLRLSYVHDGAQPPFVVYESDQPAYPPSGGEVFAVPPDALPQALLEPQTHEAPTTCGPCEMAGPLTFLGARAVESEARFDVTTWWRVTEGAVQRNFSLMAHLIRDDGSVVSTDDGLGVWPMTLAQGDIFVQRHRFTRPDDVGGLWLRTGAYWLDSVALWPVTAGGNALLVPLASLTTTPR